MPYPMDPRARLQQITQGMFGPGANIQRPGAGKWTANKFGQVVAVREKDDTLAQRSDMAEKLRKRTRKTIAQSGRSPGNNPMSYLFRG